MDNKLDQIMKVGTMLNQADEFVSIEEVATDFDIEHQDAQKIMTAYLNKYKKKTEGIFQVSHIVNTTLKTEVLGQIDTLALGDAIRSVKIVGLKKIEAKDSAVKEEEKVIKNCLKYNNFAYKPKGAAEIETVPKLQYCTLDDKKKPLENNTEIPNLKAEEVEKDGQKKTMSINHFFKNGAKPDDTKKEIKKKPAQQKSQMNFFGKK